MFPTPCIGKTSKKFGKRSFILGRILPPPAWLKCVDICFCTAAAKKNGFWQCECMLVPYSLLEPWVLAVYPQASISGATVNTGKQHPMGTEILTMMSCPESAGAWALGLDHFCKVCPPGNLPGHSSSSQWDTHFPYSLPTPTALPPALPETNRVRLFPGTLEKIYVPSGGGFHNYSPLYFLPARSFSTETAGEK